MTADLEELNAVAGTLPPTVLRELIRYAKQFQGPYWTWPGYSDEWSDEDIRDFMNQSMQHFEEEHPDEDWSDLQPMNPGERYK
jgi:hypothetical protein